MKRDSILVRKILLFVEEHGSRLFKGKVEIKGYEHVVVIDHLYLLASGGFIEFNRETLVDKGPLVLTWQGCDYLDQLRTQHA